MLGHEASKPRGDPSHEALQATRCSRPKTPPATMRSRSQRALGHEALWATRPYGLLGVLGHEALQQERKAFHAMIHSRPQGTPGYEVVYATRCSRPLGASGHKSILATRRSKPQGALDHEALWATRRARPLGAPGHEALLATRRYRIRGGLGHKTLSPQGAQSNKVL